MSFEDRQEEEIKLPEMSFKEWLYDELMTDEVIDESWDSCEINKWDLLEATDMEEADFENYWADFSQYCASIKARPVWDVE